MSGETEQQVSGWTVDTLRMALDQQLTHNRQELDRRLTEQDKLREEFDRRTIQQLVDLREMLNERYQTQTKAIDAAFIAQQTAMQTALTAAERAVITATQSAEKAVTKAEMATEKRFEGVNEFRQQLADQANTFISRVEADTRITGITDALGSELSRCTERIRDLELNARQGSGETTGLRDARTTHRLDSSVLYASITVFLFFITIGVSIYAAVKK